MGLSFSIRNLEGGETVFVENKPERVFMQLRKLGRVLLYDERDPSGVKSVHITDVFDPPSKFRSTPQAPS